MFKNNKINWALAILALIATIVVFLATQTQSANADPVPSSRPDDATHAVTVGEWYSLKSGMTRQEVREILDGPGHVADPQKHTEWYRWDGASPRFMRVVVLYDHNKMRDAFLVAKKINGGTFEVPYLRTGISARSNGDDTRPCATIGEWGALQPRMTRHEVYTIMDGKGYTIEPQVRTWNICKDALKPGHSGQISVWFKKQKVHAVYWIELSK